MSVSISVVVPVGGVDEPLSEQLQALARQDLEAEFEVILAFNSAQETMLQSLCRMVEALGDSRFRIVDASERRGASFARNTGARAARSEVLAFCDGDDVVHPTWLREITNALADFDAVGGQLHNFGLSATEAAARPPATPGELPRFLGVPYIVSSSMAITRPVFDATSGFDETLIRCEDIAISWKLLSLGFSLGFAADAHTDYRNRPGSVSMMRQHFHYGRGMSQVLMRYGIPDGPGWSQPRGFSLLRPNGQPGGRKSLVGVLRRGALAAGRSAGIVSEHTRQWRALAKR